MQHPRAALLAILSLAIPLAAGATVLCTRAATAPCRGGACSALEEQQPTFKTGVELVAIDVNVVGAQARPVDDLRPQDFTVTVDHKPRRIMSAQYINHGARSAAPARNVMIVIDSDSFDVTTGRAALKAAKGFLDHLAPTDRVGVATIPRVSTSLIFTSDRTRARADLEGIVAGQPEMPTGEQTVGLQEAFDIERNDNSTVAAVVARECRCGYPPEGYTSGSGLQACSGTQIEICVVPLLSLARQTATAAHMQAQRSIDALRDLAQGLAQVAGPKTVVLISGGLGVPETSTGFDPLEPALANGQVTLYTLYIEEMSLGQVRKRISPSFAFDDRIPMRGIENITAAAGGTLIHVVGQIESAFERVATEMSGSYLLGIEVDPADRDGKTHDVAVKVNRPGVEVRSRRRYIIEPERTAAARAETPSVAPLSAAARAARRAERAAPLIPEMDAVTPDLVGLLVRAGEFLSDYEPRIASLAADEQYEQTLARWKSGPVVTSGVTVNKEDWFVDKRRRMRSDYALVRGAGPLGWAHFRDPYEVDGSPVRERSGRLARTFSETPATALQRAAQIMAESARYNLGFGERNMDVPTLALVVLQPGMRGRFFFRKEGEEVVEGVTTSRIAYVERASPTIFAPDANTRLPLEGIFWIEPGTGRVVRSTLRLNMQETDAEVTVTYRPSVEMDGLWVPADVHESYTSDTVRLDCVARYTNLRPLK